MSEQLTRSLTLLAERGSDRTADEVLAAARTQAEDRPTLRRAPVRLAVAVGLAVMIVLGLLLADLYRQDPPPVIDDPGPTMPSGALEQIDPATWFDQRVELTRSGPDLWAYEVTTDQHGKLARYHDGAWWAYPSMPPGTFDWNRVAWDLAVLPDDSVVAATADGIQLLGPGGWQPHPDWRTVDLAPVPPRSLEVDADVATVATPPADLEVAPDNGTVWVSTVTRENENTSHAVTRLFRWDATGVTEVIPLDAMVDGNQLARTSDGSVWLTGEGQLTRYDPVDDDWEAVVGASGREGVVIDYVTSAVASPAGDLWVTITGGSDDDPDPSEGYVAHLNVASGNWSVHPHPYSGSAPQTAADDTGLWVARAGATMPGLDRFDGDTWTTYLEGSDWRAYPDRAVDDVGVAGDGTVWASQGSSVVAVPTE